MEKIFFVIHLLPTRSNFFQTLNEEEMRIIENHKKYWNDKLKKGCLYAFGPVLDPKGVYGLAIVSVNCKTELLEIIDNDPANEIGKYEYFEMKAVVPKIIIE